ncbi:MAG: hypothetical protein EHM49_08915 [Deltaproteobacteria bacterium]|nr:MAG: hypothetical protein EHM49_08915 [Deltaproteobacteria bacterium]
MVICLPDNFAIAVFGLIVEPKREERGYDCEYVLLLEDWATIDGGGPEAVKRGQLRPVMGMMGRMGMRRGLGVPLQEPLYDAYTINGYESG